MNNPFSEQSLAELEAGNIEALVNYDKQGFILGENEDPKTLAERLRKFTANRQRLDTAIANGGSYSCNGITVTAKDRIGEDKFQAVAEYTKELFGFAIDWVPGFYVNPSCSALFGGCAISQYPDFFTMFIIRRSFREKARWLIYDRDELLAHELCHVARIGLESFAYEEAFAYRTSKSWFRRFLGGMFCRPMDSFIFLGAALLLFLAQVIRVFLHPQLNINVFIVIMSLVAVWLIARHCKAMERLQRAQLGLVLSGRFNKNDIWKVLFRCSDREIFTMSRFRSTHAFCQWLEEQCQNSLRWKIIEQRFGVK